MLVNKDYHFIGQEPCWKPCYWLAGSTHLLSNHVSETFSTWQCWNPVISIGFDILKKKQIPGHVTKWNPPSFFRFRQRNRDRGSFHQIRESGFSFTCEAGGFTETESGTGFGFRQMDHALSRVVGSVSWLLIGQWQQPKWTTLLMSFTKAERLIHASQVAQ